MTTAYLQTHHKVLKAQYEAMSELCSGLHNSTYKLFCHILVCTLLKLRKQEEDEEDEEYTPISAELIRKSAYGANWKDLDDRGLIDHTAYCEEAKISKKYKVKEEVLELFFSIGKEEDYRSAIKVNLFTGTVSKLKIKSRRTDETGNSEPALIQAAIDTFEENKCIYNVQAINEHLIKSNNLRIERKEYPDFKRLNARHRNDEVCFRAVQDQETENAEHGLLKYSPAYYAISSGRIHQTKGALQSCSREMKQAAYSNIPGLKNYDLKGSQNNIAIQLMEEAGVDTSWLCTYRDTANNKYLCAELIGLTVDSWKKCLLALLMGATIPQTIEKFETSSYSIVKVLGREANGDPNEVLRLHSRLREVVSGLDKSLKQWHNWLMNTYIPANQKQGGRERKYYIHNKVDKRLCVTDLPKTKWKAKAKVAAFLLQGQEALFIHRLTVISKQYNYKPIANEHDGLITIGEIPPKAIEEAASFSGLKYAVMENKPFV